MIRRKIFSTLAIAILVFCLLFICEGLTLAPSYGKTIEKVGYGVRDLTLTSPIDSCKISCPSTITKGETITIDFSTSYEKSASAKGKFLHDGWHTAAHKYVADKPTYIWTITNSSGKVLKSVSGLAAYAMFTPTSIGTYTVQCQSVITYRPNPNVAYVGITNWTTTKMPSFTFKKSAKAKTFTVKSVVKKKAQAKPKVVEKPKAKAETKKSTPAKKPEAKKKETPKKPSPAPAVTESHWLKPVVFHTDIWEASRKAYNKKIGKSGVNAKTITLAKYKGLAKPRGRYSNVFWAGEKLMLAATADSKAKSITVKIKDTSYSTTLKKQNGQWEGSLWSLSMANHWKNSYPAGVKVVFTAKYSDDKSLSKTVNIIVDQSAYKDILHRLL